MLLVDVTATAVQLSVCQDLTYCPRNQNDLNTTCCDYHQGVNVQLSGANIAASVVSNIQRQRATALPSPSNTLAATSATPSSMRIKGSGGGYNEDQKIALGVGIGVGLPGTLATIITLGMKCIR